MTKLARTPEYEIIPTELLVMGPYKCPVHVEGWPAAFRFTHVSTQGTTSTLRSSKGTYVTNRPLLYTKRNDPRNYAR